METRELICINCPLGCSVTAQMENGEVISVEGNTCKRGETYARQELTAPARMVTTTVRLADGGMLPVRTASPVPKKSVRAVVWALKDKVADRPVRTGDVILEDAAGTGVNVIASKSKL